MDKTYQCGCGEWSGEPCQWTGPAADMVLVEWMPDEHRASHAAAGNSGSYPDNGASRAAVERSCADLMVETDGEWVRIISEEAESAATEVAADTPHTLEMWDDAGGDETVEFDGRPSAEEIAEACRDWVEGGEWGDAGASVRVNWVLADGTLAVAGDEEIDSGIEEVDIEPNHDALIRVAGGDTSCGHDWTGEGEGGCDENPGVWSTGGTSMLFVRHCTRCGLIRTERDPGSQRNPGECPTVEYSLPDDEGSIDD